MSCTKLKTCLIYGEDYKDKVILFKEGVAGLSNYKYEVKNSFGALVKTLTVGDGLEIVGTNVCIQGDALETISVGTYSASFWFDINGETRKLFDEDLRISNNGCDCANIYNLSFTIVPVEVSENTVNIYLNWDDLTPAQIQELQQPAIDAAEIANTAATNANNAATNANDAADLANQNANEANTAANNATNSAQLADNAADSALQATNEANTTNTEVELAESARVLAENDRVAQENDRQTFEDEREDNEDERILNESGRESAENTRVNNETSRQTAESNRVTAENSRVTAETNRVTSESDRVTAENSRVSSETTRQNQETTRQTNESARVTAENNRVSAESARVLAENARVANDANKTYLIMSYTHTSNIVVNVTAIDYATGTFTANAHGIPAGVQRVAIFLKPLAGNVENPFGVIPNNMNFNQIYYIYTSSLTANTFQLTTNSSGLGTPITNFTAGTNDFSKWQFEILTAIPTQFSGFQTGINNIRITLKGRIIDMSYLYPILSGAANVFTGAVNHEISEINGVISSSSAARFTAANTAGNIDTYIEVLADANNGFVQVRNSRIIRANNGSPGLLFTKSQYTHSAPTLERKKYDISGYTFHSSAFVSNGTNIKIWKL